MKIKTKILIADDEPNILMLTGVMMEDEGYEVVQAVNGEDAIFKVIEHKPDLLITDVIMPKKDGFDVCRAIRAHPDVSHIPIIILSALGDEYNKITGFEGGADDYITKPFNVEELKARVRVLLQRASLKKVALKDKGAILEQAPTGLTTFDDALNGGLPKGSNILLVGPYGCGKSTFAYDFLIHGLLGQERCLLIALDDAPNLIRRSIMQKSEAKHSHMYEEQGLLRIVDAYSWSTGYVPDNETFCVSGILDLTQLSGIIADAGSELGQSIQVKAGGRRFVDSISSLLVNFDLPSVQRFIAQVARTSVSFGGVNTFYILEEGTVSDQVLNNIKYLMDGIVEFNGQKQARIVNMKWIEYKKEWFNLGTVT